MLQNESYTLSIDRCRNVSDDAMASMLSSWINSTIHEETWVHEDFIRSLMCNQRLRSDDVEEMSCKILDALEACGLYGYLLTSQRAIDNVKCIVKGNLALVELEWARNHEHVDTRHTTEEGYRFCDER